MDKIEKAIQIDADHAERCEHNKKSLHRIRRIKGQLEGLERMIEADTGSCEDRVIRARTIEKGMNSLITHLVDCYLQNTVRLDMERDPDEAMREIRRIFELVNR